MATLHTISTLATAVFTNTANWVGGAAPSANDNILFQYDAVTAMAGSDQSGTELDDITVLATCTGNAGTADTYLQLDQGAANKVVFNGRGTWYLDMGGAGSASVRVDGTRAASNGQAGLYFKNDTAAITLFEVSGGVVRLAAANITTLVVRTGATVYIDSACTVVTINCDGGTIIDYGAAVTTWNHNGGTGTKYGSDAYAINMYAGIFYNDGTGTASAVVYGGVFDSERNTQAKNVTLTYNAGTVLHSPNVTVTGTFNTSVSITQA